MKRRTLIIVSALCAVALAFSVLITVKNSAELHTLLEDSIKSQIVSICYSAREITEEYDIEGYNAVDDMDEAYFELRSRMRELAETTGATYIYGLKYVDGECVFFLDTDTEDEEVFIPYELDDVLTAAFAGVEDAGINNLEDEYGSFHTGAVPLRNAGGDVIGIIAVDIEDTLVKQSFSASTRNMAILVATQVVVLGVMIGYIAYLLRRIYAMQSELQRMAHYDSVTNMPNRQYLFEHLAELSKREKNLKYALVFIDLDNFKAVNDTAGHDAGDALLRDVGDFLQSFQPASALSFRPTAGILNISARVGGDEFVQVVPGIETIEDAKQYAEDMLESFKNSTFNRHVKDFSVGMSVGVALCPYHAENYNVLIKYADLAMYHAKKTGKNRAVVYNDTLAPKDEK